MMQLPTIVVLKPKILDQKEPLHFLKWALKRNLLKSYQLLQEKVVTYLLLVLRKMTIYVRKLLKRREVERINTIDKLMLKMTKRPTK